MKLLHSVCDKLYDRTLVIQDAAYYGDHRISVLPVKISQ